MLLEQYVKQAVQQFHGHVNFRETLHLWQERSQDIEDIVRRDAVFDQVHSQTIDFLHIPSS